MSRKHARRVGNRQGNPSGRPAAATEAAAAPKIIGGDLRGRRLAFRPGGPTRPMKDRVRETVFDLLGTAVRGATAIDLFAGTGAIGFEALSRGAARGVFAERHFPTADCLRRSAAELGLTERATIVPGDVLLWSKRLPPLPGDGPWIVFISPPWSLFTSHGAALNSLMTTLARAAPEGSRLIVESDGSLSAEQMPGMLTDRAGETAWDNRVLLPAILHQKKL